MEVHSTATSDESGPSTCKEEKPPSPHHSWLAPPVPSFKSGDPDPVPALLWPP